MNDKVYHINIDFCNIYFYIKLVIVGCSLFNVHHDNVNFEIFKLLNTSGYSANFVLFPGAQRNQTFSQGGGKIAPALNIFRGGGQEYTPAVRLGDEWGLFVYMFKLNKLTFNYFFLRSEFFNLLRVMIHESLKQAFLRKGQVPPP